MMKSGKNVIQKMIAVAVAFAVTLAGIGFGGMAKKVKAECWGDNGDYLWERYVYGDWEYMYEKWGAEGAVNTVAVITGYHGEESELEIPAEIGGVEVRAIGWGAFRNYTNLQTINIPDGVTGIYREAFRGCTSLKSIEIPKGVECICTGAFQGCASLESIDIPDSVTVIEYHAFDGCSSLTNVMIPDGAYVKSYAFYNCPLLKSVMLPQNVCVHGFEIRSDRCFGYCDEGKIEGFTIEGYAGSTAESLAEIEGFNFVNIGAPEDGWSYEILDDGTLSITGYGRTHQFKRNLEIPTEIGTRKVTRLERVLCSPFAASLESVIIPESVAQIDEPVFDSPYCGINEDKFVIYGYINSAAEKYAKKNHLRFVALNEGATDTPTDAPEEPSFTLDATGAFAPKLEMTKDKILAALAELLTKEQFEAVKAGMESIDIQLVVTDIADSVSEADKELIAEAIEGIPDNKKFGFKVLNYLDIRLGALIGSQQLSVTETDGEITVSLAIEKPVNGTYKIVRIHDGKTDVIDSSVSKDGKRLTFQTDRFSTYAILFSDVAGGDGAPSPLAIMLVIVGIVALAAGVQVISMLRADKAAEKE